jgi:hypothetical protein
LSFLSIFDLSYFTRVWIIQEVAVSPVVDVVYGSELVSWDDLMTAIRSCVDFGINIPYDMGNTINPTSIHAARISVQLGVVWDLLELLVRYRSFEASDQKDKVYALLGLAHSGHGIKPDYRKSFTVEDAYITVGRSILMTSSHLDLLSVPRATRGVEPRLPSWIPDWRTDSDVTPLLDFSTPNEIRLSPHQNFSMPDEIKTSFRSTRDSRSKVNSNAALGRLEVYGYAVDIVDLIGGTSVDATLRGPSVGAAFTNVLDLLVENARTFMNWEEITGARSRATYLTGEDMLDAYWKTFLGGHTIRKDEEGWAEERARMEQVNEEYREPCKYHLHHSKITYGAALGFTILRKLFLGTFWRWPSQEVPADLRSPQALHRINRRMFTTRDGYIGLGPKEMQPGDSIVLLSGGRLPFVLRPDGSSFRIVGDSYVHGMMAGEKYDSERCTTIRLI